MIIKLALDINKSSGRFSTLDEAIVLRQTDAVAYAISADIREDGAVLDLTGCTVRFYGTMPDGSAIVDQATVTSASGGLIEYAIPPDFTAVVGDVQNAYFRITSSGGYSASTEGVSFRIKQAAFVEATGGDYAPEIDNVLALMEEQRIEYATDEGERSGEWMNLKAESQGATATATKAAASVTDAVGLAQTTTGTALAALREATAERNVEQYVDSIASLLVVDHLVIGTSVYAANATASGTTVTLESAEYADGAITIPETAVQDYLVDLIEQSDYEHAQRETENQMAAERSMDAARANAAAISAINEWISVAHEVELDDIASQLAADYVPLQGRIYASSAKAAANGTAITLTGATASGTTITLG